MTTAPTQPQTIDFASMMAYFVDLISDKVVEKMKKFEPPKKENEQVQRKRLDGIRGIAEFLHLSTGTVQKMKNNNTIPTYSIGNKVYAYSDELEKALKN